MYYLYSSIGTNKEYSGQGNKIFEKLVPLLKLCKNQPLRPEISHKKSFSISNTQAYKRSVNKSTKRPVLKENNAKTNTSLYNIQSKTLNTGEPKKRTLLAHHLRIRSEIAPVAPLQENASQIPTGKKSKDTSTNYYKAKESKRSSVLTTPHSPTKIVRKKGNDNGNKKSQINSSVNKTVARKVSHKRSTSDGYMVKKKAKKNELRKSPSIALKNSSLTRDRKSVV